jgi:hypothetical protein
LHGGIGGRSFGGSFPNRKRTAWAAIQRTFACVRIARLGDEKCAFEILLLSNERRSQKCSRATGSAGRPLRTADAVIAEHELANAQSALRTRCKVANIQVTTQLCIEACISIARGKLTKHSAVAKRYGTEWIPIASRSGWDEFVAHAAYPRDAGIGSTNDSTEAQPGGLFHESSNG